MHTSAARIVAASVATSIALLTAGAASGQAAQFDGKKLKSGSVAAGKIRKDTLTGLQIRESTLGIVPIASLAKLADAAKSAQEAAHAATADTAKNADHAKSADTAKSADVATSAKSADDAKKLNGRDQTAFLSNNTHTVIANGPEVTGPVGGSPSDVTASCAPGEKAIGGGGAWILPSSGLPTTFDARISASMPVIDAGELTGWQVYGRNYTGALRYLRAYAICVPKSA